MPVNNVKPRVLIVSPHFPPINAPDHQRVRMSLPYFREMGWEPCVLTVQPEYVEGQHDPQLAATVPEDIKIVRTKAFPIEHTRRFGAGSLGLRALPYLRQAGDRLLRSKTFDLVYFSTTVFTAMTLGPRWRRKFNVPYVLDFQDPWVNDYYSEVGAPPPPGGRFKYGLSHALAQLLEPRALRATSHVISVSPAYPQALRRRYSWMREDQFTVLPFGAPENDFTLLDELKIKQDIFDPQDGNRHWVYVGRGGGDQGVALRALFSAMRVERARSPEAWRAVRLHFVGTSYAQGARAVKTIEPLAIEMGVGDLVREYPQRIPYFHALKVMAESDAILLIGSNDTGYTASKIYPCILARKPLLAIFHEASSVVDILRRCTGAECVTFNSSDVPEQLQERVAAVLSQLVNAPAESVAEINWSEFQSFTAREMTRSQCTVFNNCLAAETRRAG